jgi:hypothetical protein
MTFYFRIEDDTTTCSSRSSSRQTSYLPTIIPETARKSQKGKEIDQKISHYYDFFLLGSKMTQIGAYAPITVSPDLLYQTHCRNLLK